MRWAGLIAIAMSAVGCAQVSSESPPLSQSAEARCAEFGRIANDLTTSAYRRAAAVESLRAQRCAGYR
ncbi:MAG: hypothetical protein KF807_04185 [Xanthobacteraceae bacterium]|nr:hypothetical protein [Xanthobacteraceae bacterium]